MGCCANCFGDDFLRKRIESISKLTGKCSHCGASNVPLVNPTNLRDSFELLISIYCCDDDGEPLVECLKSDWDLFEGISNAHSKELLAEILDDGEIVRKRFRPTEVDDGNSLERWQQFRDELKHQNRFFPKLVPDLKRLKELLDIYLCADSSCIPDILYRARINTNDLPHPPEKMGRPSQDLATHGRANPAGIPYLYLASDVDTAITEIRPHTGEMVSVASFMVNSGLRIADLRNPRKTISPFYQPFAQGDNEEESLSLLRKEINLLCQLGKELTRPILPKTAHLDYLPSQYLCEFIKHCGFDGVMYRSSVCTGTNFALFDRDLEPVSEIVQYKITRVSIDKEASLIVALAGSS